MLSDQTTQPDKAWNPNVVIAILVIAVAVAGLILWNLSNSSTDQTTDPVDRSDRSTSETSPSRDQSLQGDGSPIDDTNQQDVSPASEPLPTSTPVPQQTPTPTPLPSPTPTATPALPTNQAQVPRPATFLGERVNIRARPSINSEVCFVKVGRGNRVEVVSNVTNDGWYEIDTRRETSNTCSTTTGWIFGAFITPGDGDFVPAEATDGYGAKLTLARQPGGNESIVNETAGAVVLINPQAGESWWTVQLPDTTLAYVRRSRVRIVE